MYHSLYEAASDLERHGELVRITRPCDPNLEMAEIHRRVFDAGGKAILFENVIGSPFPALSNLYGTQQRTEFLFRHTLERVKRVIELKADPARFLRTPARYLSAPFTALTALPRRVRGGAVTWGETTIDQLPQIRSWGMDGGAFVTLPQVFSEDPEKRGIMNSNLGMYRIQLSGNDYVPNQEIGLHYQIHRGIGVHHTKYNALEEPFRCSVFVGGLPSHAFSAIMPLPEGLSELTFAGMLAGRAFRYTKRDGFTLSSDADFVITGTIRKKEKKREGPFGDHLGYYSLAHEFPVMDVAKVYHRRNAIWHFTVVGRPPAEDSYFGWLIHQLVKELTGGEFPGLVSIHAVDAAGVHPLLLAVGSERYMPFRDAKPEEILTIANRIIGSGQTSLAKYLFIGAINDDPSLDAHHIPRFFRHILERIDLTRDLHFQTRTTIDTLDYSGSGWNEGSKVVVAACGTKRRDLGNAVPTSLVLPQGFDAPTVALDGILVIRAPKYAKDGKITALVTMLEEQSALVEGFPLIILVDDAAFTAATLNNFVWVTFTRSNPATDIYGLFAQTVDKHWGCRVSMIIDARIKPHHAPVLEVDASVKARVDSLFAKGGELHGIA